MNQYYIVFTYLIFLSVSACGSGQQNQSKQESINNSEALENGHLLTQSKIDAILKLNGLDQKTVSRGLVTALGAEKIDPKTVPTLAAELDRQLSIDCAATCRIQKR